MTITERLMKPGSFSIRLREDYPWSVAAAVDVFDHIVVTPGRLDATTDLSDATILATAIYTGVVVAKPSPRIFEGAGLAWWLGTDEGLGDVLDVAVTQTAASLSTWISALLPGSLTLGTVSNTGLGTHTGTYQWVTRREAIDAVCRALGAEWRINPNKTFDAAKAPNLFVSSPTTVITRREEGQDGGYRGLDGSMIVTSKDVRQYTTKAIVVAAGAGVSVATGSSTGTTAYRDGNNNLVVLERLVNAPSDPSTSASAIAAAVVGQWNQVRRELSLSSRTYNVTRHVRPGDYVYVFDQLAELTDSANQITARADLITPIKLRVHALTWPAQLGMGVYARRSTGSDYTYTDLTDHVEWETSDVTWDVGAAPRASNDVDAKLAGSTAYLGANAAVAERAAEAPASRCEARPPGTQVLTSGVGAAVELTAENTDTGGFHDNSTNNTRLTAPYSGVYFVSYTMDIAAQAGGDRSFWFAKNGGSVRYAATNAIGTTARHEMCGSCDIELDAGDYVELIAYQSSGVSLYTGTQSWCAVQIRYVSAV